MARKGDIWISAVLYLALGVIVIALILGASLPVIEKLKDRNTVAETKTVMLAMDNTIKIVAKEGPGSQRELSPLVINKGKLGIDEQQDKISWEMVTSALIMEPGVVIKEGVLTLLLKPTPVKDEYLMTMTMDYHDQIDLAFHSPYQPPFTGRYSTLVHHTGTYTTLPSGEDIPIVGITLA